MIQSFEQFTPEVHPRAWVHDSAVLIGEVRLAEGVSVWPTVVLRGDMGLIEIGRDTNLQDGVIAHDTSGKSVTRVGERVTVGHRAILHGCIVEDECLIGMGAILMDNVVVGKGSFVAAGTLVPPGRVIPPNSMVMGSPGRVVRKAGEREAKAIEYSWKVYRERMDTWLAQ